MIRGVVPLVVCGQQLTIAPTYKAIEAIEARLGVGIPALYGRALSGDVRVRDMAVIVHEGLRGAGHVGSNGAGEAFTLEAVGEDVMDDFTRYSSAVGEFLGNALGGRNRKKDEPAATRSKGRRRPSGGLTISASPPASSSSLQSSSGA